jgi:hypothetical protein
MASSRSTIGSLCGGAEPQAQFRSSHPPSLFPLALCADSKSGDLLAARATLKWNRLRCHLITGDTTRREIVTIAEAMPGHFALRVSAPEQGEPEITYRAAAHAESRDSGAQLAGVSLHATVKSDAAELGLAELTTDERGLAMTARTVPTLAYDYYNPDEWQAAPPLRLTVR